MNKTHRKCGSLGDIIVEKSLIDENDDRSGPPSLSECYLLPDVTRVTHSGSLPLREASFNALEWSDLINSPDDRLEPDEWALLMQKESESEELLQVSHDDNAIFDIRSTPSPQPYHPDDASWPKIVNSVNKPMAAHSDGTNTISQVFHERTEATRETKAPSTHLMGPKPFSVFLESYYQRQEEQKRKIFSKIETSTFDLADAVVKDEIDVQTTDQHPTDAIPIVNEPVHLLEMDHSVNCSSISPTPSEDVIDHQPEVLVKPGVVKSGLVSPKVTVTPCLTSHWHSEVVTESEGWLDPSDQWLQVIYQSDIKESTDNWAAPQKLKKVRFLEAVEQIPNLEYPDGDDEVVQKVVDCSEYDLEEKPEVGCLVFLVFEYLLKVWLTKKKSIGRSVGKYGRIWTFFKGGGVELEKRDCVEKLEGKFKKNMFDKLFKKKTQLG